MLIPATSSLWRACQLLPQPLASLTTVLRSMACHCDEDPCVAGTRDKGCRDVRWLHGHNATDACQAVPASHPMSLIQVNTASCAACWIRYLIRYLTPVHMELPISPQGDHFITNTHQPCRHELCFTSTKLLNCCRRRELTAQAPYALRMPAQQTTITTTPGALIMPWQQ